MGKDALLEEMTYLSTTPLDFAGRPYRVGQEVLKATVLGSAPGNCPCLVKRRVTKVEGGKVWLSVLTLIPGKQQHQPLRRPERCYIIGDGE